MAAYRYHGVGEAGIDGERAPENEEVSLMLANALRKMDGLIGADSDSNTSESPTHRNPLAMSLVAQSETLRALVEEWEETVKLTDRLGGEGGRQNQGNVQLNISQDTRDFLISWLSGHRMDTSFSLHHLENKKEELIQQIVAREEEVKQKTLQLEVMAHRLSEQQSLLREKDAQNQTLTERLETAHHTIDAREREITLLTREKEYWPSSNHDNQEAITMHTGMHLMDFERNLDDTPRISQPQEGGLKRGVARRKSLRKSIARAFGRKKDHTGGRDEEEETDQTSTNFRASAFHAKDRYELGQWMESVGLEMYRGLVEQHVPSGDSLVAITRKQDNSDLVHIGIVSTLHCKKLRLAVEEALRPHPSPLEGLGHTWVAEWLQLIGLPQYKTTFYEARIDSNMLNLISMEDLSLLEVTNPFHRLSLQRAVQAFRLCGYSADYLKNPTAAAKGSQKLLHWTAQDVAVWLCSIDLDEYVSSLHNKGVHGALMLLEDRFTSTTLARILGIQETKIIIRKHLAKKFMEVLGPVAAQRKVDAMQTKHFQALDYEERSKSTKSKKARQFRSMENLLCSLETYPASDPPPQRHLTPQPHHQALTSSQLQNLGVSRSFTPSLSSSAQWPSPPAPPHRGAFTH